MKFKNTLTAAIFTSSVLACGPDSSDNKQDQGIVVIDTDMGAPDSGNNNNPDMPDASIDIAPDMNPNCTPGGMLANETAAAFGLRIAEATKICFGPGLNLSPEFSLDTDRHILPTSGFECRFKSPSSVKEPVQLMAYRCLPNGLDLKVTQETKTLTLQVVADLDLPDLGLTTNYVVAQFPEGTINGDVTITAGGDNITSQCSVTQNVISCEEITPSVSFNKPIQFRFKEPLTDKPLSVILESNFPSNGIYDSISTRVSLKK